jgi:outer membrane protein TolC
MTGSARKSAIETGHWRANLLIAKALPLRPPVDSSSSMKYLRRYLAFVLLVAGLRAAEADASANDVTLPEELFPALRSLLNNAVQQSPRMLNRALDLEIAENNRIAARSGLLPSVGGYASYLESRDTRADLSGRLDVTKIAYNFTANQPLYFWGERKNNAKMGEIQASIAKGQYAEGYRLLAATLRSDYLRLIVQKVALKRADAFLDHARSQLRKEEARLQQKVISEFQIYPTRLQAEQAQIASERAHFDFEMAKASFARLAGCAPLTDETIPDMIPPVAHQATAYDRLLAGYLAQGESPSVEAVTLRKQIENETLSTANAKTRLLPKFSAVLGVSQDEQSYTINVAQKYRVNSVFAGVSANWTIFDGFAARAAVRIGNARVRQMKNDYKDLTERLAQQAQTQAKLIGFSARSMAISDRNLTASEGSLKSKQDEFSRGVTAEDEVTLARIALLDAQVQAYNGRIDYFARAGDFLGTVVKDPVLANVANVK